MAAEVVVGAMLASSLDGLFKRMASQEVLEFFQRKRLSDQLLKKMKLKLLSANAVLNDAEKKQIENPNVKKWLDELQQVIYDAQDLMDSINTEALERKVEGESASFKLRRIFSTTNRTDQKVEEILDLLEYTLNEKDQLGLQGGVQNMLLQRTPATSLVEESSIYGRNSEKDAIIKFLLSDEITSNNKISVIPIVGMGGVGKTTLAQLIYNDDRVEKCFDCKVWVHVSEEFDILRITKIIADKVHEQLKTIENGVTTKKDDGNDLDTLQVRLKEDLKGKMFLLVLDDVWNERYESWDELKKPFASVACGSKIIVTTRNEGVASVMRDVPSYQLGTLSGDDCWKLFVKHAFNNVDQPSSHPKLEEIGRKIVQKCQGLPLARKSLGGLLRHQLNPEEWMKILHSDLWELPKEKNSILPVLWISYHYLPAHLKRCFSYCSLFPKNHTIDKDELIKLWMAEDLIQPSGKKMIEEVGEEYFHELLSRSLFQQSKGRYGSIYFGMHDLVNDLATFISEELSLRWNEGDSIKPSRKIRHLSHFGSCGDRGMENYKDLLRDNHKYLRTVFFSPFSYDTHLYKYKVIQKLFTLSSLRVLSLVNFRILKLPDSIGNLKSLRYLDLSSTEIDELPNTVCTLYNLQTLLLRNCAWLKRLPADMGKLISLRHLDLDNELWRPTPLGIGTLKNLQTLPYFIVRKQRHSGSNIKDLQDLQLLRGSLRILELENVINVEDVLMANLKDKQYLSNLEFDWSFTNSGSYCPPLHEQVLDRLQPHTNIKFIKISHYMSEQFPKWIGDNSFCNLERIHLLGCKRCFLLPPLGQLPFLKELEIRGFDELKKIGDEFYCNVGCSMVNKPFRCLELLQFQDMPEWKEWSFIEKDGVDHFPSLKKLYLSNCPKLTGGLCLLETLETVQLSQCNKLEFPGKHCYTSLKEMEIKSSCHFMKSIHLDYLPMLNRLLLEGLESLESASFGGLPAPNIQDIRIADCKKLRSLPDHMNTFLPFLQSLDISSCPELESFGEGRGLPAPNIQDIRIADCKKLRSLPDHMNTFLPSLRSLDISSCPELESFGEGGLPSNLSKLSFYSRCNTFTSGIQHWNLQSLTSLTELNITIMDKALDSFPQEGMLPTTLTQLSIESPHLKALDGKALLHLVSLKKLCIAFCYELQLMPKEGLPASLTNLVIKGCPYLKSRCLRDIGEDWHKIAHIPSISLEYKEI